MINEPKFKFSDSVVIVYDDLTGCIGCVVKSWHNEKANSYTYEVYVRSVNNIHEFPEEELRHFIRSKEILPEEAELYGIENPVKE